MDWWKEAEEEIRECGAGHIVYEQSSARCLELYPTTSCCAESADNDNNKKFDWCIGRMGYLVISITSEGWV